MADRASETVRIRGREFRVLTAGGADSLQQVANYLDETMSIVEERTGTVDSLDLALLTALNLAREIVDIREGRVSSGALGVDAERLQSLIALAESALAVEGTSQ